jgi:pimeloyl-ACP methyl ester carboxylesterase
VIAHDFGAAVALELASTHPEVVSRLVLISPVRDANQLRAMATRARDALGAEGSRALADLSTPQGTLRDPRQLGALFRALGPLWWARAPAPGLPERLARDVRYRPESDEHFLLQLAQWDGLRRARGVRCETLVVAGAQDRTFLPAESRSIADTVAHGRYVELADAGHLPFVEQPAAFTDATRAFLRGAQAAR